jgi:hypothetical protein
MNSQIGGKAMRSLHLAAPSLVSYSWGQLSSLRKGDSKYYLGVSDCCGFDLDLAYSIIHNPIAELQFYKAVDTLILKPCFTTGVDCSHQKCVGESRCVSRSKDELKRRAGSIHLLHL